MTRKFLITAATILMLGITTPASAVGIIVVEIQEGDGEIEFVRGNTTSARDIVWAHTPIGFDIVAGSITGQVGPGDREDVLINEGFTSNLLIIGGSGSVEAVTVYVSYLFNFIPEGNWNLISNFTVGLLTPDWSVSMEIEISDLLQTEFLPLVSAMFTTAGAVTEISPFDEQFDNYVMVRTIYRVSTPTNGGLQASLRILAERADAVAVPEPSSLAALGSALTGLVPWVARRRRYMATGGHA